MNRFALIVALPAAVVMAAAPALAAAQSPQAWVEALYAHYGSGNFNLFEKPEQWFAPDLLAAMKLNDDLTPDDEIGAVDHDPVCQCQDDGGMKARVVKVETKGTIAATVHVELDWGGGDGARVIRLSLVRVDGDWRIHDIIDGEGESFLAYVRQANREAREAAVAQ